MLALFVAIAAISASQADLPKENRRPQSVEAGPVVVAQPENCPAYADGAAPPAGVTGEEIAGGTATSKPESSPEADSERQWVRVGPGQDIQPIVDASPPGSAFLLEAGLHLGQSIRPRDGDAFVGESGTVLSGESRVQHAFLGSAHDVTICGLVIEDYATPAQMGTINGDGDSWLIVGNEIRNNTGAGITLNDRYRVIGNAIHHNHQIGLKGAGEDILIQNNEISFNNSGDEYDMSWEAGGAKFLRTTDLVVRGNFVHDNHGHGLWTDTNNLRSLYEDNFVIGNYGAGIFHEISYDAIIRANRIEENAFEHALGGIRVVSSRNVEVTENQLVGNNGGVYVAQSDRGEGLYGPFVVENLWVHDNRISFTEGWSGLRASDALGIAVYSTMNNRFDGNIYHLEPAGTPFVWMNRELDVDEWRLSGLDASGTFR